MVTYELYRLVCNLLFSFLVFQGAVMEPVSYTHLDVYKRQIHFYGIICKCKVCDVFSQITGVIQINDIGVLFTVRLCIGFGNFASVSYTHLDVYKRQVDYRVKQEFESQMKEREVYKRQIHYWYGRHWKKQSCQSLCTDEP